MKIVCVNASGALSGAERVLLRLMDVATSSGHEVVLVCPPGELAESAGPAVRHVAIAELGLGGARSPRAYAAFARAVAAAVRTIRRELDPTGRVVVNSTLAAPVAVCLGRRTTWIVHDVLAQGLRRAVGCVSAPFVGRIVAVSDAAAAPLRRVSRRVTVVHNGTPVGPRPPGPGDRFRVIGCLAALVPWKGHRTLIDAMALLADVDVRLEIAGAEFDSAMGYEDELRARVSRTGTGDRVTFLGHVPATAALASWDALVLPSIQPEAMPLSVLEAFAAGVPVVATDHGGSRELVAPGCGILVPPGDPVALADAIRRLADEPAARRELVEAGYARVRDHYELGRQIRQLLQACTGTP